MKATACTFGAVLYRLMRHMVIHDRGTGGVVDVQGVCKSTVVRGEGGFPSGTMRVSDCHDTVVYALAPLQVPQPCKRIRSHCTSTGACAPTI